MASPESDPLKELHALTTKAGESLGDDAAFDAAVNEINDKLRVAELEHLDKLIGITKQYESQLEVLRNTGIMFRLSDGSEGIFEEDGTEYPVPSLLSIVQRFCEDGKKYELLRQKVEQGFKEMILVPFGWTVNILTDAYIEQLKLHKAAGQLFGEGKSPAANSAVQAQVLGLNMMQPVNKWARYETSPLVYFPTSFDPVNHGGLTKKEAIAQKGAWQVCLIEETPIPRKDQGANKNGRQQLEAGLTSRQYLEKLQTHPQYRGEVGLTLEAWLMRALTRLKKKNEVTDDFQGNGSSNYILGAYFPESLAVGNTYWYSEASQVYMVRDSASYCIEYAGTSSAVMI